MMDIKNFHAIHDKELVAEMIAEGEHVCQDFKYSITDSRKIARSISAFANNQGGRLLVGVKDNGNIAGIRTEEDFYMIEQAAEMYCRPPQRVDQRVYNVVGKFVLLVKIHKSEDPVFAQDDNRHWQPYFRIEDQNIQVPEIVVRVWRAKEKRKTPVAFTEEELGLLRFVAEVGHTDIQAIAMALHFSLVNTEKMVVALCSIGVLDFVYADGNWRITSCIGTERQFVE